MKSSHLSKITVVAAFLPPLTVLLAVVVNYHGIDYLTALLIVLSTGFTGLTLAMLRVVDAIRSHPGIVIGGYILITGQSS